MGRLHSRLQPQSLSPCHVCRPLPHSGPKATEAADQPTGYLLNMLDIPHASFFPTLCPFLDSPATQDLPGQLLLPSAFWAEEWAPLPHGEMVKWGDCWGSDHRSPGEPTGTRATGAMVEVLSMDNPGSEREDWLGEKLPPQRVPLCSLQDRPTLGTHVHFKCLKQSALGGGRHWLWPPPTPAQPAVGSAAHSKAPPP